MKSTSFENGTERGSLTRLRITCEKEELEITKENSRKVRTKGEKGKARSDQRVTNVKKRTQS